MDANKNCRKYKQKIENLKMDLEELQEKYKTVLAEKANQKKRFEKEIAALKEID